MELRPPNILMEPTLHRPRVVVSPRRAAHLARKVPINAAVLTGAFETSKVHCSRVRADRAAE